HFCSHSAPHHLHLHSFPTRRSSDLVVAKEPMAENRRRRVCDPDLGRVVQQCPSAGAARLRPASRVRGGPLPSTGRYRRKWLRRIDRKSTRLNSSHVSISYAVFCLKK